ncbi:plant cysteine oxidase 1-like isoform X2 [Coffea eugenioides]|uniref:plant cysteine oxidase 1-like isoform X2 n=1 Tax=Coffea eugenioides TaxID=49369 RepID=UPI000F613192|nr:plant cysteine oxidase 1-like isoform X2 [Coffea eugenioides]
MKTVPKKAKNKSKKQKKKREMANVVQELYQTCSEVFADGDHQIAGYIPPAPDIERLKSVLDRMKPEDLNLSPNMPMFRRSSTAQEASHPRITYIELHECDQFSIGIFCLPPSAVIPLHNHPNMTVFSKLLFGALRIKSYDWVDDGTSSTSKINTGEITHRGNMHCFTALTACAILDVLGPPYSESEGRHCTFFQDFPYDKFSGGAEELVPTDEEVTKKYAWLQEIEKPEDYIDGGPS